MKRIILIGSPNVGKSVIFNALTGGNVTVANYPGSTVDYTRGEFRSGGRAYAVIDTPGMYSLDAFTEDEAVTRKVLEKEPFDLLIHVVDAKHIRRMLPTTLYFIEMGVPVILVLNMMDEARKLGIRVQGGRLADLLGIPVVLAAAASGRGLRELKKAIVARTMERSTVFSYRREDAETLRQRQTRAEEEIAKTVCVKDVGRHGVQRFLHELTQQPLTGIPILLLVLYFGLYQFVGVLGAGVFVDAIHTFFEVWVTPSARELAHRWIAWDWLREILVGEYGMYSIGVCYAVSIVLPIVGVFFFVFAILEDSGYLPRMALLMDRLFKCFGLNGKAVIPVVLGLGCGTMAILVTRTLGTKRERVLTSFLLALAIPCSAQLGVMMSVLSSHERLLFLWGGYLALIFVAAGWLGNRLLRGRSSPFCMELPPLRIPLPKQILRKTGYKVAQYLKEILPIFLMTSLLLSAMQIMGLLEKIIAALTPCMRWLLLPDALAPVLLLGFFRRDYGAAGLYELCERGGLSDAQLLIAAVMLTLCMPCVAQVMMLVKERGVVSSASVLLLTLLVAFLSGYLMRYFVWLM